MAAPAATIEVTILSPEEILFRGQAHRVILPGEQGVFEVAPFHRGLVSRLLPGMIVIDDQYVPIRRGVMKVAHDVLTAIVEPEAS